ncbi:MAG: hypothetical protein ACMUHX_05325 [bacterium]
MIDKIIILIIIFFVFKSVFRFFSEEEEKKRKAGSQSHIPPVRTTHPPPSKTETGRPPSGQDLPLTWSEIRKVLRDLKTEAEGKQGGFKIPEEFPARQPEAIFIQTQHEEIRREDQKAPSPVHKKIRPKKVTGETVSLVKEKAVRKDKIKGAEISFDQPGLLIQGIILSEILRPPVAIRSNRLLPPYLRG